MKKNRWLMVVSMVIVTVLVLGVASTVWAQEGTPATETTIETLPEPVVSRQSLGFGYGRDSARNTGQRLAVRQRLMDGSGAGGQYGYGEGLCLNDGVCVQNENQQRMGNGFGMQGAQGQQFGQEQGAGQGAGGQGQQLRDGSCGNQGVCDGTCPNSPNRN